MKLVAGLGNPGRKYVGTRHNVGWDVLAELARRFATGQPRAKFNGELVEAEIAGEKVILLSPLTYMNRSGDCIQPVRDFYKLDNTDLLILCDDFNLPAAKLRVRSQGSAGGQKGLQDVIQRLGTNKIARLRIGIGTPPPQWDISDYVLSRFTAEEQTSMRTAVERAADAVVVWVRDGIETCMNQFNAEPERSARKTDQKKSNEDRGVEPTEATPENGAEADSP